MIPPDLTGLRFAGFIIRPAREVRQSDRRVPRYVSAHRYIEENCVYSHEAEEPGRWDDFRLDRPLKDLIPARMRNRALQAVSDLAAEPGRCGRPNICLSRDALRSVLAAARVPRDKLLILEAGFRPGDAEEVLTREDLCAGSSRDREPTHGIVEALRTGAAHSGEGEYLGVEPWLLDRRLKAGWREGNDSRAVRARAFSRLNEYGLLEDFIGFDLFVPGLTPRRPHRRRARWLPLVLVRHAVESMIGDPKRRVLRSSR